MSEPTQDLSKTAQDLVTLIATQPGAVVSRVLVNKPGGTVTLFAFDAGEGLSEHAAPYDALVHVLEGKAAVRIGSDDMKSKRAISSCCQQTSRMRSRPILRSKCC